MENRYCKLGQRWCDNLDTCGENNGTNTNRFPSSANATCIGVYKDNGPDCASGRFFLIQNGSCPFEDREHTRLTIEAKKAGYFLRDANNKETDDEYDTHN